MADDRQFLELDCFGALACILHSDAIKDNDPEAAAGAHQLAKDTLLAMEPLHDAAFGGYDQSQESSVLLHLDHGARRLPLLN